MIFVTTFGIGLAAGLTRSLLSLIAASTAVLATLAAAALLSGGASLIALAAAVGGYNLGLIAYFVSELLNGEEAA